MAESLREAAMAVGRVWSQGRSAEDHDFVLAMSDLDNALESPDPIAEARKIIEAFVQDTEKGSIVDWRLRVTAREWLKRNGGD